MNIKVSWEDNMDLPLQHKGEISNEVSDLFSLAHLLSTAVNAAGFSQVRSVTLHLSRGGTVSSDF